MRARQAGPDGTILAAGGRVLTICGTGPELQQARDRGLCRGGCRAWPEGFCRRDIGRPRAMTLTTLKRNAATASPNGCRAPASPAGGMRNGCWPKALISLNGKVVTHPATFIAAGDVVQVNGKVVDQPDRTRVWRYHKPEGLVTTHKDPEGRPTVFDKLKHQLPRVVSVGRLDLTSEGLLLLTNDGGLARQLELPSNGWLRRYRVRVFGVPNEGALKALAHGVTVEGVRYGPIEAAVDARKGDNTWLTVSLREGRNREIRRVMDASGAGGFPADPGRLWAVPTWHAGAWRDRGNAGRGCCASNCRRTRERRRRCRANARCGLSAAPGGAARWWRRRGRGRARQLTGYGRPCSTC